MREFLPTALQRPAFAPCRRALNLLTVQFSWPSERRLGFLADVPPGRTAVSGVRCRCGSPGNRGACSWKAPSLPRVAGPADRGICVPADSPAASGDSYGCRGPSHLLTAFTTATLCTGPGHLLAPGPRLGMTLRETAITVTHSYGLAPAGDTEAAPTPGRHSTSHGRPASLERGKCWKTRVCYKAGMSSPGLARRRGRKISSFCLVGSGSLISP